jgi:HEAT repeat protein
MSSGPALPALSPEEVQRVERVDHLMAGGSPVVAELVAMLDDRSWTVRRAVVAALASSGAAAVGPLCQVLRRGRDDEARVAATVDALSTLNAEVEAPLVAMATDADPAVVADVAQILGRRRTVAGVATLAGLTRHADDNVAVAAIEALGRVGGRAAVDSLIASVGSGNFFRIFPAIDVLGRSGDPRAVAPLTALLDQPQYASEAARALGRTGDGAAVPALVQLLRWGSGAAVRVAALALAELHHRHAERFGNAEGIEADIGRVAGDPGTARHIVGALGDGDPREQGAICFVLGALGDPSAAPALTSLLDGPLPVARAAGDALRRLGPEAATQVLQGLREGDSGHKRALLPLVSRPDAADDVANCLADPDPDVRVAACEALGRIGAVGWVRAVFPLLADTNTRVSFAAMAAIQALGGAETESLATAAARADDARVRRMAMRILGYFGFPSALELFLRALEDPDERVRESAIQGLPFLEDPRATEALLRVSRDPSPRTRGAAMRALGQCASDLRLSACLIKGLGDSDSWVRYYACQALGRLAFEPATEAIVDLLEDPAGQVRVAAVEALACLRGDSALAALKTLATNAEPDIQRAALVGLGVAARADSLPVVLAATTSADPATRLVALAAVAGFKSPEVLQAIERAASDGDESVRTASIGFLAAVPGVAATKALVGLLRDAPATEPIVSALSVMVEGRIAGLLAALETADDELAPYLTSALARLRRPDAAAALIGVMTMPSSRARKAVATTLLAQGTREALAALKAAAAADPEPEVRQICALLLAR